MFFTILLTSCPGTAGSGGSNPAPQPVTKYKITLEHTGGGTVTVKPALFEDGMVAENTEITFRVWPTNGYKLQKWELNGDTVNGPALTYKLKVTQNAHVKAFFEPRSNTPSVYLVGEIKGASGKWKPCYWKNGTKYELPIDTEAQKGRACSLTLNEGEFYIAGYEDNAGVSRALVWEGNSVYWKSPKQETSAQVIFTEDFSLYIAGQLEKDGKREAALADITNNTAVNIVHLRTRTGTEDDSCAYGLCSSPTAFYAVGTIGNSVADQSKGALWTINKNLTEDTRTETILATGDMVEPRAVCLLGNTAYAAGCNEPHTATRWKVVGTGSGATVTSTALEDESDQSEANAACTKDGFVFVVGEKDLTEPCVWKGKDNTFTRISLSTEIGGVNALYVFGTDIYAAGCIDDNGHYYKAAYWKFKANASGTDDVEETVINDYKDAQALGILVTME